MSFTRAQIMHIATALDPGCFRVQGSVGIMQKIAQQEATEGAERVLKARATLPDRDALMASLSVSERVESVS